MFDIFSKTQEAFGLDISANSFKILQLQGTSKQVDLRGIADVPLPKGLIINDGIADSKTFSYMLHQALAKPAYGRISTPYAVVSLPESKSFVRVIQLPIMGEAEAASAVPFEAESFVPLPIDQVYLDWQILGKAGDKMNVLMIASPKDFVDKYLEILDKSGVIPVALEVESQSCHRALVNSTLKENVLLVDISATRTSLIMVEEGDLQFTSTIPLAGNSFTESIAKTLGVSSAKAEAVKMQVGFANTTDYPNVKTALMSVLNGLAAEIRNVIRFHIEHSGKEVNKIVLTGGGAALRNLPEYLQAEFQDQPDVSVTLADPWLNIQGLQKSPVSLKDSLALATVIGLSMRGLHYEE